MSRIEKSGNPSFSRKEVGITVVSGLALAYAALHGCANDAPDIHCEEGVSYTAHDGDTLIDITEKNNANPDVPRELYLRELAGMNPEAVPILYAGQTITLPYCTRQNQT